ncbi:hypothetical protein ACFQ0R_09205 [Psychroflexus salinarum]|uniref:Uncharacterized protein n=1 Tax=Psychroflexus salinarum TaxID=546024 RepID=A0ABW3GT12_9FLAO
MKKILLILLSIVSNISFGQSLDVNILKGKLNEDKIINTTLLFSENDGNDGLIIVRNTETVLSYNPYPKEYYIEHYDKELKLVKKITLTNEKKTHLKGMIIENGNVSLIQFDYDNESQIVNVNILESKIKDLEFEKRLLKSFDKKTFNRYFGNFSSDYLSEQFRFISENPFGKIEFSENKKFFTIQFEHIEKKNQIYYFTVYDNNFVEKFDVKHSNQDKYSDFQSIDVSDYDGTLFLLKKNYENESRKDEKRGNTNYNYELYKFKDESNQQIKLKESSKFISSLFILPKAESVSLVGFYSTEGQDYLEGVCHYNLDLNNLKINKKSFEPLTEQFYRDKYRKGKDEKSKRIRNLEIRSLFFDKKENIIITAEEYTIVNPNFSQQNMFFSERSNSGLRKKNVHHYDDILSIKINSNGKILWSRNINKRQTGTLKSSFISAYVNGRMHYFINGNLKELKDGRFEFIQAGSRKSNLYLISIDEFGVKNQKLIEDKRSKFWYDVRNGITSLDLKSVIFQGIKKRDKQIIKISIQ